MKIGANRCKHCGADPYGGGLQGMQARNDDLSALIKIKREHGGVGSWPWQRKWRWWKWPIMWFLIPAFLGLGLQVVELIFEEGAGWVHALFLAPFLWLLGYLIWWLY
ncbi:MAG: hypothetical protein HOH86_12270 [Verrucomicrobiales bacterium]|nr:hypothetical protein [Verrucomicrobiales bacterium]